MGGDGRLPDGDGAGQDGLQGAGAGAAGGEVAVGVQRPLADAELTDHQAIGVDRVSPGAIVRLPVLAIGREQLAHPWREGQQAAVDELSFAGKSGGIAWLGGWCWAHGDVAGTSKIGVYAENPCKHWAVYDVDGEAPLSVDRQTPCAATLLPSLSTLLH